MEKEEDLRIVKTKKALYNALLELMRNKTFEEIRTNDICKTALVNRSTFYSHYEDKYDLLVDLLNNQKELLLGKLKINNQLINTKEYFMEVLKIMLKHLEENKDIYTSILLKNRNGILIDLLIDVVNKDINERLNDTNIEFNTEVPKNIVARFYLGAILGIGVEVLMDTNKYSKEQIILYLDKLIPEKL